MHIGTDVELMRAVRSGKSISITKMTMRMASRRSLRKERTDLSTTLGWSVMRWTWMSGVMVASYSLMMSSTLAPKSTTLLPGRISIESITQRLPRAEVSLYLMWGFDSSYRGSTVSTSRRRSTCPVSGSEKMTISLRSYTLSKGMATCTKALPSLLLTLPEMVLKPWAASSADTTEGEMAYCVSFIGSMWTAISSFWVPTTLMRPISGMVRRRADSCLATASSSRGERSALSMANSSDDALPKSSMTAVVTTPCGRFVRR